MAKLSPWPLLSLFLAILIIDFSTSSCATRSAPSGGPKDTAAPAVDTTYPPNFSTYFDSKSIVIEFDEYITLKNPSQQITFSPALKNKPEIETRGKDIRITWKDTLLDETTYTISFGSSITDYREGNVNDRFKYVFSTGSFIDSLTFTGSVYSSQDGTAESGILVGLYDLMQIKFKDSIPFKQIPTYYTYTDESGKFDFANLKYSKYHVIAFEDKRGNFMMNTGQEKTAFHSDTISLTDSTETIQLYTFIPKSTPRFFGGKHVSWGKIELAFNYFVKDLEVEFPVDSLEYSLIPDESKDTAHIWFDQNNRDSLRFYVIKDEVVFDTVILFLRPFKAPDFRLTPKKDQMTFEEPVLITTSFPVKSWNKEKIVMYTETDTIGIDSVSRHSDMRIEIHPEKKPSKYNLYFKEGAVTNIAGDGNDSLNFKLSTLTRSELGSLDFIVETDSSQQLVLVIYSPKNEVIFRQSFRGSIKVPLRNKPAGVYGIQMIIDEDGDGKWSTGNYLEGHQPEKIIKYQEQAEIRVNWELELIWQPKIGF